MPKLQDLTGQKFDKLTVIKRAPNRNGKTAWICQCDCGNQTTILAYSLKLKKFHSCGCERKENLSNQHFGKLIAIKATDKRDNNRSVIWECKCKCGNIAYVSAHNLKTGNTKSCGCLIEETSRQIGENNKIDLTGQVFGRLTVLKDSKERKDGSVLWECKCECGNITKIKGTNLLHGVQSCGCLKSKGEEKIAKILSLNNIKFNTQKTFETCRFDNGRLAFFDFYLPDYNILIEYDGEQHFSYRNEGWNNKENYEKTIERDNYKNQWCKNNNIKLIRVPYTKLNILSLEDLLS